MSKKPGPWERWDEQLRSGGDDLRAEVVLSELLISELVGADDVVLAPTGGFQRAAEHDIERLTPPGSVAWAPKRAVVEMNRGSIYDLLPEAVFHEVRRTRALVSTVDAVEEVRRNKAIEEAARRFVLPLDHELLITRVQVELNERRMTAEFLMEKANRGLIRFWAPPEEFSGRELGKLLMLMPQCHRMTGDPIQMGRAISEVLGLQARVEHRFVDRVPDEWPQQPALEAMHLGVDSVLQGSPVTTDWIMVVMLGPLVSEVADNFAPGGSGSTKLNRLMELFAPADQGWALELKVIPSSEGSCLEAGAVSCRLGVSTILS